MRRIVIDSIGMLALFAVTVSAAGPRTPAPSSIQLNVPAGSVTAFSAGSAGATIWPSIGDSVTFAVTFPKSAEKYGPRIQVMCYQGDLLVYGMAGAYTEAFMLGGAGSIWVYETSAFGAHCKADLYYWSYQGSQQFNLLASTEFDAAGTGTP